MPGPWLLLFALLLAPPVEHELDPDSCVIVVEVGDAWPERTLECPSWTIVQPFPEDDELDVLLVPEFRSPRFRRSCELYLIRPRFGFLDAMIEQAAGMLAKPISSAPRPRAGLRGCS